MSFSLLFFQRVLGIPESILSGTSATPVIDLSNHIWSICGALMLLFTVVGIWLAQFGFFAKQTGGPGQYFNRCLTVGFSLLGYKIIFAGIMWTGALVAYQIMPTTTIAGSGVPWLPAGQLSIKVNGGTSVPTATPDPNGTAPSVFNTTLDPAAQEALKKKSVIDWIGWGITTAFNYTFNAGPATLIIALCNICFVIAVILISAIWLMFAIVLYCLGPFMITAGLIPEYGEKLWGSWIAATIQCSLWQVWMAFCGKMITSSLFTQISQLNPMNRASATDAGVTQTAVMDLQQAAYALVFLLMYVSTPFIINYIFPLGNSSALGGLILGAAYAAAGDLSKAGKSAAGRSGKGAAASKAGAGSSAGGASTTAAPEVGNGVNDPATAARFGGSEGASSGQSSRGYATSSAESGTTTSGSGNQGKGTNRGYQSSGAQPIPGTWGNAPDNSKNNAGSTGSAGSDGEGFDTEAGNNWSQSEAAENAKATGSLSGSSSGQGASSGAAGSGSSNSSKGGGEHSSTGADYDSSSLSGNSAVSDAGGFSEGGGGGGGSHDSDSDPYAGMDEYERADAEMMASFTEEDLVDPSEIRDEFKRGYKDPENPRNTPLNKVPFGAKFGKYPDGSSVQIDPSHMETKEEYDARMASYKAYDEKVAERERKTKRN